MKRSIHCYRGRKDPVRRVLETNGRSQKVNGHHWCHMLKPDEWSCDCCWTSEERAAHTCECPCHQETT